MAIKKKKYVIYLVVAIAIVVGIVLGAVGASQMSGPSDGAKACIKSGGVIVVHQFGAFDCVQKNLKPGIDTPPPVR